MSIELNPLKQITAGRFAVCWRRGISLLLTGFLGLALAGCGGGGGSPPSPEPVADNPEEIRVVRGGFTKGPVAGASIAAFPIDAAGFKANAMPLATTVSDARGRFTLQLAPVVGDLLIESSGGEYVDESDQEPNPALKRRITLGQNEGLQVVLPEGSSQVAVTMLGQAVLEKARREAGGSNFGAVFDAARAQASQAYGFDVATTLPQDPISPDPGAPLAQRQYAMVLGGLASVLNRTAILVGEPVPNNAIIQAVVDDLSDGRIDGLLMGQSVEVLVDQVAVPLPTTLVLSEEIARFRNNNFSAYSNTPLATVNENLLSQPVTANNNVPVASADNYSLDNGASLAIAAPGLLANDTDADGDALTAQLVTAPIRASAFNLAADGSFSYTHDGSGPGTDSFTYRVSDGVNSSVTATVTLTITTQQPLPPNTYSVDRTIGPAGSITGTITTDGTIGPLFPSPNGTVPAIASFDLTVNDGTDVFTLSSAAGARFSIQADPGTEVLTATPTELLINFDPAASNTFVSIISTTFNPNIVQFQWQFVIGSGLERVSHADQNVSPQLTHLQDNTGLSGSVAIAMSAGTTSSPLDDPSWVQVGRMHNDGGMFDGNCDLVSTCSFGMMTTSPTDQPDDFWIPFPVTANDILFITGDGQFWAIGSYAEVESIVAAAAGVFTPNISWSDAGRDGASVGPLDGNILMRTNGEDPWVTLEGNHCNNGCAEILWGEINFVGSHIALSEAHGGINVYVRPAPGGNNSPVATADAYAMDEGAALVIPAPGVLGNDADADNDPLSAVVAAGPVNGQLNLGPDGSFTYVHNGSETTSDSFTYTVTDGNGGSAVGTVTISVNPVNDPPLAVDDSYIVDEGATLAVAAPGLLANDADPDGDALSAAIAAPPVNGQIGLAPDGSFTYTHNGSETTTDSFTYTVSDGNGGSAVGTVTISINLLNDAPVAAPDSYMVDEGALLSVAAPGVLANDTDAENDALTAELVTPPANGQLLLNGDGSFDYTHDGSETTTDSFTYLVSDGNGGSASGSVSLTINPVNDAPVALPDGYIVDFVGGTAVGDPGVLANDTDAENDPLTALLVAPPAHGQLTLEPDGFFIYQHDGSLNFLDSFTYEVSDGNGGQAIANVDIVINQVNADGTIPYTPAEVPSVIYSVGQQTFNRGFPFTATMNPDNSGTFAGRNYEGEAAIVWSIDAVGRLVIDFPQPLSAGTFLQNASCPDGSPSMQYERESFLERVTIVRQEDGPVQDRVNVLTQSRTTWLSPCDFLPDQVSVSSPDASNEQLLFGPDGVQPFTAGELTATANAFQYFHTDNDGNPNSPPEFVMDVLDFNADGSGLTRRRQFAFTWVIDTDGSLILNFTNGDSNRFIRLAELDDGVASSIVFGDMVGVPTMVDSSAVIQVNEPIAFDNPVVANKRYRSAVAVEDENTETFDFVFFPDLSACRNPGGNYTWSLVNGRIELIRDQGFLVRYRTWQPMRLVGSRYYVIETLQFYDPMTEMPIDPDVTPGRLNFYEVRQDLDGNLRPMPQNDLLAASVDTPLSIPVSVLLANDGDPENDELRVTSIDGVSANGGVITARTDDFGNPVGLTYTPPPGFTGTDSFTYSMTDLYCSFDPTFTATVQVEVSQGGAVNGSPVAVDDAYSLTEGAILSVFAPGVLANDTDADNDVLSAVVDTPPASGQLSLNADGSFAYTHDGSDILTDTFTYTVSDGNGGTAIGTVNLSISLVNDPPTAVADSYVVDEGGTLVIAAPGVLENDSDDENDPFSLVPETITTPNGQVSIAGDGSFTYTHDGSETASDSFNYTLIDQLGRTTTGFVSIVINPINDAPLANDDFHILAQGATLSIAAPGVLINDFDPDGDLLSAVLVTPPSNGQVSLFPDGSFVYAHNGSATSADSFTYSVSDGQLTSNTATVSLSISPIIDTTVDWNGGESVAPFGDGGAGDVYGQTFVPPTGSPRLDNLSFWLTHQEPAGQDLFFSIVVMQWAGDRAVGPILFESALQVITPQQSVMTQYFVPTGGLILQEGVEYVAFLSANNFLWDATTTLIAVGFRGADPYSQGAAWFLDTNNDPGLYTAIPWGNTFGPADLVVLFEFSQDPGQADSDGDGLSDAIEASLGTDPFNPDTDNDGVSDFEEVNVDGNPTDANVVAQGDTDPLNPDTDNDGVGDGLEFLNLTDPHLADQVLFVSAANGDDLNDGSSWAQAVRTQMAVVEIVQTADFPLYVLYEGGNYGSMVIGSTPSPQLTLVGSVGPSIYLPEFPLTTVFDGAFTGQVLVLSDVPSITLQNILVINGNNTFGLAGGIEVLGLTDVFLYQMEIKENFTTESGGGLYVDGLSRVEVFDSLIAGNSASNAGGGAYAIGDLEISGTLIANNSAFSGGGVHLDQGLGNGATIVNSGILSNSATNGGGIRIDGSGDGLILYNNLITGNWAFDTGGGINAVGESDLLSISAQFNTIAYNEAGSRSGGYAGINGCDNYFGSKDFFANIVYFNDDPNVSVEPLDANFFVEQGSGAVCGPDARTAFEASVFINGDTFIDFESFAPGTDLTTQVAGVTFASISDVNGNPTPPVHVEVSAAQGQTDGNTIVGAPCAACTDDGRVRYEIVFDTPQRRVGLQRIWNNYTVTRFFDETGGLLREFSGGENVSGYGFVGYASASADPATWVKRVEIDGEILGTSRQVGYTDDLFFGSMGSNPDFGLGEGMFVEFNDIEGGPLGDNGIAADPVFVAGFFLDQSLSPAIDGYVGAPVEFSLIEPNTITDPAGVPDSGDADLGFHFDKGGSPVIDSAEPDTTISNYEGGPVALDFNLFSGAELLDSPTELVGVCLGAGTTLPGAQISGLTSIDPVPTCTSALASVVDDFTYRVFVEGQPFSVGEVVLDIYINGSATPISTTFIFTGP